MLDREAKGTMTKHESGVACENPGIVLRVRSVPWRDL